MPKKLEAKVIDSYRAGSITAFSGREYVRSEWRAVPAGFEEQAKKHALLEVREAGSQDVPVVPAPAAQEPVSVEVVIPEEPPQNMTVDDYKTLADEPPPAPAKKPTRRKKEG